MVILSWIVVGLLVMWSVQWFFAGYRYAILEAAVNGGPGISPGELMLLRFVSTR